MSAGKHVGAIVHGASPCCMEFIDEYLGSEGTLAPERARSHLLARWCVDDWMEDGERRRIIHGVDGCPRVEGSDTPSISISRSAGHAVVALGIGNLGVDIERMRSVVNPHEVARATWPTSMIGALEAEPRAFFALWTAGEAMGKALGNGLIGLRDREIRVHRVDHGWELALEFLRTRPIHTWPGFAASLCADARVVPAGLRVQFIDHFMAVQPGTASPRSSCATT